jgi:hypothetical protein
MTNFPYRYPACCRKSSPSNRGNDRNGHGYGPGIRHRNCESPYLAARNSRSDLLNYSAAHGSRRHSADLGQTIDRKGRIRSRICKPKQLHSCLSKGVWSPAFELRRGKRPGFDIRFPSAINGADVAFTVTERFAATGVGGYSDFNYSEPKNAITRAQSESQCACSLDVFGEADHWERYDEAQAS